MKTLWKKKVERWAAEFLYGLDDDQFESWIRNIKFYRLLRKNMTFTLITRPVPLPSATGAGTFYFHK